MNCKEGILTFVMIKQGFDVMISSYFMITFRSWPVFGLLMSNSNDNVMMNNVYCGLSSKCLHIVLNPYNSLEEVDALVHPIFQMKTLRFKEVKRLLRSCFCK
jgi:hypothetical protein